MIFSIITVTKDDNQALRRTLLSVAAQRGMKYEHIIIDSGSYDRSELMAEFPLTTWHKRKPEGVYAAINEGLRLSTGDIIGLIHGGDMLAYDTVLQDIRTRLNTCPTAGYLYADLRYFRPEDQTLGRVYRGAHFSTKNLRRGFSPPHPTLYMRRWALEAIGEYSTDYMIASDFDYWIRLAYSKPKITGVYIPKVMVLMATGGLSTRLANRLLLNPRERMHIMRSHGLPANIISLLGKYFILFKK